MSLQQRYEIFPYSWVSDDKDEKGTTIDIYGVDRKGESVAVKINDFTPYVYIELPQMNWTPEKIALLRREINKQTSDKITGIGAPLEFCFMKDYTKLYYANMKDGEKIKYPFIKAYFASRENIKKLKFKLKYIRYIQGIGQITLKIHEYEASTVLQFISTKKLSTSGWIEFVGKRVKPTEKETTCPHEFIVSYKNTKLLNDDRTGKPLILSWDCEMNSTNISAMPNPNREGDRIFQISCVFFRQGDSLDKMEKYLLTLVPKSDLNLHLDGITIRKFKTEGDLILGFTNIIQEKNPNILVGYNIFGFDIQYVCTRSKLSATGNCYNRFVKMGVRPHISAQEKTIKWTSSAYKDQNFQFLDAEGRLFVDLLPLVKRDYKLNNYQLKTVATHFIGQTKDPLDHKGIFKCYNLGMKGGEKGKKALELVGKYCVQDSALVVVLFEKLKTWIGLCEMSRLTKVPHFALFTQGQQLKVFSQVYYKCTQDKIVVDKDSYVANANDFYVGATVLDPVPGVYDKVVPLDFNSLYPSMAIAYNLSWDTLVNDNTPEGKAIPDSDCNIFEWDDHIGCDHDPRIIRKKELDKIIDKKEKDLKIARTARDKKENKFHRQDYVEKVADLLEETKPFRKERSTIMKKKNKHIICEHRRFRFLKKPEGVLASLLRNLLDARKAVKNEMKDIAKKNKEQISDADKKAFESLLEVYEQRQLALKLSANSGYGATGVQKGYLPMMAVAMCITYMGRKSIETSIKAINTEYKGKLVYGDTDSNYVSFSHLNTAKECWEYAEFVASEISKKFPPPIKIAFEEKIYWVFAILTKKRYMSLACKKDGIIDREIQKKGVLLSRRDNANVVRQIYSKLMMGWFDKLDPDVIIYNLLEDWNRMCSRYYPYSDFVVTKAVGSIAKSEKGEYIITEEKDEKGKTVHKCGSYKVDKLPDDEKERIRELERKMCDTVEEYYLTQFPAQVQLAEKMRRRGNIVDAGTRLEYVITTQGGLRAKQFEKIESYDYFLKHTKSLEIDYYSYMKLMSTPFDQVLNIVLSTSKHESANPTNTFENKEVNFALAQFKFRSKARLNMLNQLKKLFAPKLIFRE